MNWTDIGHLRRKQTVGELLHSSLPWSRRWGWSGKGWLWSRASDPRPATFLVRLLALETFYKPRSCSKISIGFTHIYASSLETTRSRSFQPPLLWKNVK